MTRDFRSDNPLTPPLGIEEDLRCHTGWPESFNRYSSLSIVTLDIHIQKA